MFLGVVNLTVGEGQRETRRLNWLIALIRDYNDRKADRVQSEELIKQQLLIDKRDLSLFTNTFFRNVHQRITDAIGRQRLRLLSTDITQIGRNWYSKGANTLVEHLQEKLQDLFEVSEDKGFGRLRPEVMGEFFDGVVDVLLGPEYDRNGNKIEIESFPFDRVLHIPLLFGDSDAARYPTFAR